MKHRELQIVALKMHDEWSASFSDEPETGYGGATARDAARRLLTACDRVDLEHDYLTEGSAVEQTDRMELTIRVFRK
ncbi:hypothetical protein ETAA8_40050 [Anatilimnocola aggregata]|uniref:Uncharacterized protein n=1 Tax=Anatilimnocola aggregata TaxID=2528021 RepID=A0A517YF98_9BACT|nr:hypothetical protein [Anatilimnocola aggregata]QDU28899.1 hypothetical protein ETAA8_40050 [Anatilimnocola aggregata]